jgi:hypothetical protein
MECIESCWRDPRALIGSNSAARVSRGKFLAFQYIGVERNQLEMLFGRLVP